jgi:hypothetical protein
MSKRTILIVLAAVAVLLGGAVAMHGKGGGLHKRIVSAVHGH